MKKKVAKSKDGKVAVQLNLDLEAYSFIMDISRLTKVSRDDVIAVILAIEIGKAKRADEQEAKAVTERKAIAKTISRLKKSKKSTDSV